MCAPLLGVIAAVLPLLAIIGTCLAICVLSIQAAAGVAISGRSLAIMAITMSSIALLAKGGSSSILGVGIAAIPLILGSLYLSPSKIIDLRQLGYGLIGSFTIPALLNLICYCGLVACKELD